LIPFRSQPSTPRLREGYALLHQHDPEPAGLNRLLEACGDSPRSTDRWERVLARSAWHLVVLDPGGLLVGFVRATSDLALNANLWDLVADPADPFRDEVIAARAQIDDGDIGRPVRTPALTEALRAALSERGCSLTEDVRTADLRISIDADTREAGSGSGFFTATLDATIVIRGADNAVVLQRNLDRVKGVQLNFEAASAEAYRKASQELRGSFSDELLKSLYR
jgi:hypothetical protein